MSNHQSNPSTPSPSFSNLPLNPQNIRAAHKLIQPYIHRTPLLTRQTLNTIASTPRFPGAANPQINLYFKCENYQKIGAFKARGAHHAVIRLIESIGIEEVRRRGIITHSSGNHAQALSLAAQRFAIPAYIIMPSISTPSKITATQALTPNVVFSGSTSQDREEKVKEVVERTGAILIPPYDHGDVVLGQGTVGVEMEGQFAGRKEGQVCTVGNADEVEGEEGEDEKGGFKRPQKQLDAIIAPCGGGGLLAGIATYFSSSTTNDNENEIIPPSDQQALPQQEKQNHPRGRKRKTPLIFGAEPSFQAADDAKRALVSGSGERITHVSSLTIADGLRTPLGRINWEVIRQSSNVEAIYSVTETEIKESMRLLLERAKWVVEPSGAVALAVVLFNEEFREWVAERQRDEREAVGLGVGVGGEGGKQGKGEPRPWNIGIVISGGNTTVQAIGALFGKDSGKGEEKKSGVEREMGKITMDGEKVAEDIAG